MEFNAISFAFIQLKLNIDIDAKQCPFQCASNGITIGLH